MPKNLAELLKKKRESMELTQVQLGKKVGVGQPTLSEYETGKKLPGRETLKALSQVLGLSINSLYEGAPASARIDIKVSWTKRTEGSSALLEPEADYLPVPIVDVKVAAGPPQEIRPEQIMDIAIIHRRALKRRNEAGLVCTFVKGDSMEPIFRDGAVVCIDTEDRPDRGKVPKHSIWAVRKDEGTVIKHIQTERDSIILISENPSYPVEVVRDPSAIIGRVVWAWQNYG